MIGFLDENKAKQIVDLVLEYSSKQYGSPKTALMDGLFKEESYKSKLQYQAEAILCTSIWNETMIRSGEIAKRMKCTVGMKGNNLVSWQHKDRFEEMLDARPIESGQVLFNL